MVYQVKLEGQWWAEELGQKLLCTQKGAATELSRPHVAWGAEPTLSTHARRLSLGLDG